MHAMTLPFQQDHRTLGNTALIQHGLDAMSAVEVEFKWRMASQGWWVDSARFASDAGYASELLRLATKSQSFALRECAWLLQHPSD